LGSFLTISTKYDWLGPGGQNGDPVTPSHIHSSWSNTNLCHCNNVNKVPHLDLPCCSWSPNYSVLVTRCDFVAYGQGMQKTLQRFFM
jgi:hypothetical protein